MIVCPGIEGRTIAVDESFLWFSLRSHLIFQ